MAVLKLRDDDPERELDFELDHQLSLSFAERLQMMLDESERIARTLIENGQREPTALLKRPSR